MLLPPEQVSHQFVYLDISTAARAYFSTFTNSWRVVNALERSTMERLEALFEWTMDANTLYTIDTRINGMEKPVHIIAVCKYIAHQAHRVSWVIGFITPEEHEQLQAVIPAERESFIISHLAVSGDRALLWRETHGKKQGDDLAE